MATHEIGVPIVKKTGDETKAKGTSGTKSPSLSLDDPLIKYLMMRARGYSVADCRKILKIKNDKVSGWNKREEVKELLIWLNKSFPPKADPPKKENSRSPKNAAEKPFPASDTDRAQFLDSELFKLAARVEKQETQLRAIELYLARHSEVSRKIDLSPSESYAKRELVLDLEPWAPEDEPTANC